MTKATEQKFVEFVRDCQFSLDPYIKDQAKKLMREWLGPEQDCGVADDGWIGEDGKWNQ